MNFFVGSLRGTWSELAVRAANNEILITRVICPGAMTAIQVFTISEGDLFDWVRSFLIGAITFTVITEWQTNENYDVPPNTAGA